MAYVDGPKSFLAGEAIVEGERVKVESGTVTNPAEVISAGAGEQHIGIALHAAADGAYVSVRMRNANGTFEGIANEAFDVGDTLYGAAAGYIADTSSGSAIGIALEAATAQGDKVEYAEFAVLSTTAGTVSIADAGGHTATTTVEAALQEVYLNTLNAQNFIPVALHSLRETTAFDVGNVAANGGLLASDTTPVMDAINAATDGCQRVLWAASNNDQVVFQTPLPPDLDVASDIVVHMRIVSGGTTDPVGFTVDSFFNEGDTKVVDTSGTNQTTTWAEVTATIAAADVPAGAQTLTVGLTPVAHTTDTLAMSAVWIEYTKVLLT